MNLRERQDRFIETLALFPAWPERFDWLIERSDELPRTCPDMLLKFRIADCPSRTCFLAEAGGGLLHVAGWSNATTVRGLIASMLEMFEGVTLDDLRATDINFHTSSGLLYNLTSLRRDGLLEMIHRIKAAEEPRRDRYANEYRDL
jgi:sulfur transfer protein SufE